MYSTTRVPRMNRASREGASERLLGEGIGDATQVKVVVPREYLNHDETPAHMSTRIHDILMCQVLQAGDPFVLRARVHQEDKTPVQCRVKYVYPYETGPSQVVPTTFLLVECEGVPPAAAGAGTREPKETLAVEKQGKKGGHDKYVDSLVELLTMPIKFRNILRDYPSVKLPTGVLLSGPPGAGKTWAVRQAIERCNGTPVSVGEEEHVRPTFKLFPVNGTDIFRELKNGSGSGEKKLREIFASAQAFGRRTSGRSSARAGRAPGGGMERFQESFPVIFIDEIDVLCPHRGKGSTNATRLVAQLLTLMDGVATKGPLGPRVYVFCATNRPNDIDEALRRPGRFDREVVFHPPTLGDKVSMMRYHCKSMSLEKGLVDRDFEGLRRVAQRCVGYNGADIAALCREAGLAAAAAAGSGVAKEHFQKALALVSPSATRGEHFLFFQKGASRTWDDIGGLETVKRQVRRAVEWPLQRKKELSRMGILAPKGILLHGPPGCAKTTIARTAAATSNASFITLSGGDMYSAYVGESERLIRTTFHQARQALPAIIFFDEIDTIVGKRSFGGGGGGGSDGVQTRILSTLLNEMDGIVGSNRLLVIAATNRVDMVDPALLRPGRFDVHIHVPLPNRTERGHIMRTFLRNVDVASVGLSNDGFHSNLVDYAKSDHCDGFSGAELKQLVHAKVTECMHHGLP